MTEKRKLMSSKGSEFQSLETLIEASPTVFMFEFKLEDPLSRSGAELNKVIGVEMAGQELRTLY